MVSGDCLPAGRRGQFPARGRSGRYRGPLRGRAGPGRRGRCRLLPDDRVIAAGRPCPAGRRRPRRAPA